MNARVALTTLAAVMLALGGALHAQRGNPQPPVPARTAAPIDLTGTWVSIVTQDWRWRMVPPPKGDYRGIPMTPDAYKVAAAWNPARDEAAGCVDRIGGRLCAHPLIVAGVTLCASPGSRAAS